MDRPALIQRVREALCQTQLSAKEPEDLVEKWAGKLKLVPRDLHDPRREHLWKKYRLASRAHID